MNIVLAAGVVVGFAAILERLGLPTCAREVGQHSTTCLEVLRDDSLSDAAKETALQDRARQLFGLFGRLTGGSVLALGLPLGGVWLLGSAGVGSFGETLATLQRVDFLIVTTAVGLLAYVLAPYARASS
ncbi:hypothetical protein [Salinibacter altiplanensis]|uniref:hypothetical protein n=1 Tax=Salinibacter altiplanensis TaxID=1803181 RepID=UPI000C9EF76D|nr:hypothetical protein [Salinibacter altiplanensis]